MRRGHARSLAASALAAGTLIALAVFGSAGAQSPVPVPDPSGATPDTSPYYQGTKYTQVARPGDAYWTQVAGEAFPTAKVAAGTMVGDATPKTVDFYAVDFRNANDGFAGGADCVTPGVTDDGLAGCTDRVPAVYRYSDPTGSGGTWTKVDLPGADTRGYVAAIAYLGPDRVLAVGGDGSYPPREQDPTDPANDPAGRARAWLYDSGQWTELTNLPAGMRGLTALGSSQRPEDCGPGASDCAYAGGLEQLWRWSDGQFSPASFDDGGSPTSTFPANVPFRIRSLRFMPGDPGSPPPTQAVAVTTGCCSSDPTQDSPAILSLAGGRWYVGHLSVGSADGTGAPAATNAQSLPDSFYAVAPSGTTANDVSIVASPGRPAGNTPDVNSAVIGKVPARPKGDVINDPIQTGQGPVTGQNSDYPGSDAGTELVSGVPNDVRLTAGDGDFLHAPVDSPSWQATVDSPTGAVNIPQYLTVTEYPDAGPDGWMDWAVGEIAGTDRAAAYTTTTTHRGTGVPDPLDCGGGAPGASCQVRSSDAIREQNSSHSTFLLTSYGLNAYSMPESNVGWAVGDRGAIERLGAAAAGTSTGTSGGGALTPLGAHDASSLPDTTPYDPFAPEPSGKPGAVPPLAARPLRRLADAAVFSAGTPDPGTRAADPVQSIASIATSRDGSEAWGVGAITPSNGALTLEHYVDGEWRQCSPIPIDRQEQPDDACAGLGEVATPDSSNGLSPVFTAIARVPLEYDGDPGNDDEFQAVAVGTTYRNHPLVAQYRGGRWSYDASAVSALPASDPSSVAFDAPDDGWLTSGGSPAQIGHYDGSSWQLCPTGCHDPDSVLPSGAQTDLHVQTAGRRVFLWGTVPGADSGSAGAAAINSVTGTVGATDIPFVYVRDSDKPCNGQGDPGCWRNAGDGTLNPGPNGSLKGQIESLSVAQNQDGSYSGWAVGKFSDGSTNGSLLRLVTDAAGQTSWQLWTKPDAAADYLNLPVETAAIKRQIQITVIAGATDGDSRALVARTEANNYQPDLEFPGGGAAGAWRTLATPWMQTGGAVGDLTYQGTTELVAPDGSGGAWLEVAPRGGGDFSETGDAYSPKTLMYRYTRAAHQPVFDDVAHPIREPITATATGPDGSFWVTTSGATVYRYSRLTGWDRMTIKGWEPGRLVTHPSPAYAIAVGPDGRGLMVGDHGRIADLDPAGGILDDLAGGACSDGGVCGTSQTLRAVAIAPDGSALTGGDGAALLWRPGPHKPFQAVDVPAAGSTTRFTGIAMPSGDRAWLASNRGEIFAGQLSGGAWSWHVENRNAAGDLLNLGPHGSRLGLQAIAVDADGHGYAVGWHGLVLERTGDGSQPWRRLETGFREDLDSLALGANGSALIGGWGGLILTLDHGRFEVAREPDLFDPVTNANSNFPGHIVGVAMAPGPHDGDVEAWAAEQMPLGDPPDSVANRNAPPTAILHYSSDPSDPLLSAGPHARPGSDSIAAPGALTFAAFGKSDCAGDSQDFCAEPLRSGLFNDRISSAIVDGISTAAHEHGGPSFALFTGDVADAGGQASHAVLATHTAYTPVDDDIVHKRWAEQVARPLAAAGVPLFGAIGGQDLSETQACVFAYGCAGAKKTGLTLPWRQALAGMPAPWGTGAAYPATASGFTFAPAPGTADAGGQARTHYAVDVDKDGKPVARIVVLDSSSRSLQTADAQQNPVEDETTWLQTALSRPANVPAIVLTNTPTYSYGPGAATDTETDATTLETQLGQGNATVVVSGRIGWNALYYATAPGVHCPQPGGAYPSGPPKGPGDCSAATSTNGAVSQVDGPAYAAQQQALNSAANALQPLGQQLPPQVAPQHVDPNAATGAVLPQPLPFVIASGAGGKFAADAASTSASDGYWHGYTVIRLVPRTDPQTGKPTGAYQSVVEQRPVFDWVGISANAHVVHAGRTVTLSGFGREPVGIDQPIRYDTIDSPAVTHQFDLLAADPQKPYMPMTNADGGYLQLPTTVGSIDPQSGAVKGGDGRYPETFAIARLTVGDKVATYPLVFEPRKSFRQAPAPPPVVQAASVVVQPRPPAPIVLSQQPAALPPSQPPPSVPTPGNLNISLPSPGGLPPLGASATPTATPPAPPAPPPPAAPTGPTALQLTLNPPALNVPPQGSVIPPPAPPIQPAPPGGARKEARQKQAATAKSESSNSEGASESSSEGGGDGNAMTRHDARRPAPYAFTAVSDRPQASAWTTDLLYGGSIAVLALALAGGWTARPRARRKPPDVPAPAWSRHNRR